MIELHKVLVGGNVHSLQLRARKGEEHGFWLPAESSKLCSVYRLANRKLHSM